MSRILLVSEDELTDLAHTSKLHVLSDLNAALVANPEADITAVIGELWDAVLAEGSGFDPYAVHGAEEESVEDQNPDEQAADEEDPEGVSFYEATEDDSLGYDESVEEVEETEPVYAEAVYAEEGVAYTEFDHVQDRDQEAGSVEEEPQAVERYETPVFPRDVEQQRDSNFRINRRILAREIAQVDTPDEK